MAKHWGKIGQATPGEKRARIAWLRAELGRGAGDAADGKELFTKHCAACHTLFGEGGKVGPDLTTADRKNRDYLLTHSSIRRCTSGRSSWPTTSPRSTAAGCPAWSANRPRRA